jgi:hypothetical protein
LAGAFFVEAEDPASPFGYPMTEYPPSMGFTPNWIFGLEYNYAAFETKSYQLTGAAAGLYTFDAKPRDIQSAVVRLSYKFGAPVVARY